jgi:crotonobetainyl-CoA:carnitine CoA-transferase CaiB-like acyl-CoA transferase
VPYADFGTAMTLALGTMMALYHCQATGRGQHVEAALLPTALMLSNAFLIERDLLGVEKPRMGNRGTSVAPCDLFKVTDGWVLLQVAGQPMFRRWCRLVGREDLFDDPRFANDDLRWEHGDVLNDLMQEWCSGRTKAEALGLLEAAKLPAAPVNSPADVLADPHVAAMGYLERLDYPGAAKPVPITRTPFTLSETPGTIRRRAPLLGEHTEEILAALGYDADACAMLRAREIV